MNDRKVKLCQLADTVKISKEHVGFTLHEHFSMSKLFSKWVRACSLLTKSNGFAPESNRLSSEWTAISWKGYGLSIWASPNGIIFDYLEKGNTINSGYYSVIGAFEERNRGKAASFEEEEEVLFHQGNTSCHKSVKTMAKLHKLGFELFPYPAYSLDLTRGDYWFFSDFKKILADKKFHSNEETNAEDKSLYKKC